MVPSITDSGGTPVMLLPLGLVVIVSMIKDIFEDLKRHNSDNVENNKKTLQLNPATNTLQ
jgi:hypothetical protein